MRIRDVRQPQSGPTKGGRTPIVKFNIEVVEGVLLYDAIVEKAPDGKFFLFTPKSSWGAPTASFSPAVREKLIRQALDAFGDANDRHTAAA